MMKPIALVIIIMIIAKMIMTTKINLFVGRNAF